MPKRLLASATLGLLLLPWLLFLWGWLKWPIALLSTSCLLAAFWQALRGWRDDDERIELPAVLIAGAIALAWVSLSGIGGFGYANFMDWDKHNAVLRDLVTHPWPVIYGPSGDSERPAAAPLVYYLGYYLVPAAFGKAFGWRAANLALIAESWFAFTIALVWVKVHARASSVLAGVLFVFASGLDVIGVAGYAGLRGALTGAMNGQHMEWWYEVYEYSANTTLAFWVPQHAIPAWLCMALWADRRSRVPKGGYAVVVATMLVSLWSVYSAIGMLPWLAYRGFRYWRTSLDRRIAWLIVPSVVMMLFYASRSKAIGIEGATLATVASWHFAWFHFLEWGIYAAVVWWFVPALRSGVAAVSAVLFILPLVPMVGHRDFVMRASIPALFFLWLLVIRNVASARTPAAGRVLLCLVLACGSLTASSSLVRSLHYYHLGAPEESAEMTVPGLQPDRVRRQYLGNPDSVFFVRLARVRH